MEKKIYRPRTSIVDVITGAEDTAGSNPIRFRIIGTIAPNNAPVITMDVTPSATVLEIRSV